MIRELLIPLDGYEQSETVGRWAGRFAAVIGARVTLLGVASNGSSTFGDIHQRYSSGPWTESDYIEAQAESYLRSIADEIGVDEPEPRVVIKRGSADSEIPKAAIEYKADAVVLATRRVSALSRAVLGSVTDRVIKSASTPVIATNPESAMTLTTSPDVPTQIIVTLDGSELSEAAIEPAIDLASQAGSRILFVRAVVGAFASEQSDELKKERKQCLDYMAPFRERAAESGVDAECRVTAGSPARAIIDASKSDSNSLIMMTTHGRSGFKRAVLGSVADQVLRSAATPVFVLPPPK